MAKPSPRDAPILTGRDLNKAYGPQVVLNAVSVSVHPGDRLGLVGINGSGKSTLARVLAGLVSPDSGEVALRRDAKVLYLEQEPELDGTLAAREVVAEGLGAWQRAMSEHAAIGAQMGDPGANLEALVAAQDAAAQRVERLGGWEQAHRIDAMLEKLGVLRPGDAVGQMSGGERRRVALARILVAQPELAILDEPTNHLDVDTIEWLERFLVEEYEGALLLVTHDRYFLDRVVSRTLELDRGTLHVFEGGWEDYLRAKAERLEFEARTEANRQNFLRRELDWLRRQPKARTGKQKARIGRAHSALANKPVLRKEEIQRLELDAARSGKSMLELKNLRVEIGGKRLIDGLDLILKKGERIGVVGPNGAGKTTLFRILTGELEPKRGRVILGQNTELAYFDQQRSGLDDQDSVIDSVGGGRRRVQVGGREVDLRGWLGGFLFDGDKQTQKVGSLSGGERARVLLARMLLKPTNLMLLDEPTNDLDVVTLGRLEAMLVDFDGTALVVTHDRYFLDRIATSILSFEGDGKVVRYAGSYQAFRAQRPDPREAGKGARSVAPEPVEAKLAPSAKAPKLSYKEKRELEGMMARIDAAEAEQGRLQSELADPELYATRGSEVAGLQQDLEQAKARVEALVARWEELESKEG